MEINCFANFLSHSSSRSPSSSSCLPPTFAGEGRRVWGRRLNINKNPGNTSRLTWRRESMREGGKKPSFFVVTLVLECMKCVLLFPTHSLSLAAAGEAASLIQSLQQQSSRLFPTSTPSTHDRHTHSSLDVPSRLESLLPFVSSLRVTPFKSSLD